MHLTTRIFLSTTAFIVVAYCSDWVFYELAIRYEMWDTGTPTRQGLEDDFGLMILGITVVGPASLIAAAFASWLVWCKLPKLAE